ncbi:(2Fe-2S)-binding protein [Clostridium sp. AL.422]|uniref:(2Fe-2S)-binding protein n=1 Tax=Clostridium TaxID=1485 RepID=UPI00293DCC4E|nr:MULTISPECIES: (2Fe-2S)-binding protein [unclassified Clostridium]MDV4151503.1 (2Fe-2S)-binding protein [Clostridium sp. AL.422]
MVGERKICRCRNVSYLDIRKAMKLGARDIEDIMEITGAATCCGGCTSEVLSILDSVCTCNSVSVNEVISAVNNGYNTVDKVGEITKAGTTCGRCSSLIQSIIERKK